VHVCVLGSGSAGNAVWIESGGTRVLVDAGLSLRETARRCLQHGLRIRELDAILLTHEHADHAYGAAIIARKLVARVYATAGTFGALRDPPPAELRSIVRAEVPFTVGALTVKPVAVPHDASEPVAFVVEDARSRAAVATDLGAVTAEVVSALRDLDALVLEFNHDTRLLSEALYPPSVKRRIQGGLGHLSNADGAHLLRRVVHRGLRHVVLAHLSDQSNTELHARREAEPILERAGAQASLLIATQARALAPIEVATRPFRAKQLSLFA
jgi:phosphoribosyl 1,2-cyclic phosphodiesterase